MLEAVLSRCEVVLGRYEDKLICLKLDQEQDCLKLCWIELDKITRNTSLYLLLIIN